MDWSQIELAKAKEKLALAQNNLKQETHNLIHLLVKAGCSKEYISTVITAILKSAGITTKGSISHWTVSCILMEEYSWIHCSPDEPTNPTSHF